MHPALSVILFSTLSGAGYGLWFWWGASLLGHHRDFGPKDYFTLALGALLVSAGLLSSTWHLGRRERAWRAFSQWRSSWLSREGIVALLCFAPALALAFVPQAGALQSTLACSLMLLGMLTVLCTAKIYHCLKPVPAWRHASVIPLYLLSSLYSGGLCLAAIYAIRTFAPALCLMAVLLWLLVRSYWRHNDQPLPVSRASALGLPETRTARVFEHPHTEANFITKEMVHVLARKHGRVLRRAHLLLALLLPSLLCLLAAWAHWPWLYAVATVAGLAGVFIGRWLFFAQARHVVGLYY